MSGKDAIMVVSSFAALIANTVVVTGVSLSFRAACAALDCARVVDANLPARQGAIP